MAKQQRSGRTPTPSTRQGSAKGVAPATPPPSRVSRNVVMVAVVAVIVVLGGVAAAGLGGLGGSGSTATPTAVVVAGAPAASITSQEAAARWEAGALLLDVREDSEWAAGHVPGATHIPLGQLASRVAELPSDQTILVICRSGNRSQEGRDILLAAGVAPVTSVDGGVKAWRDAGLPYDGEII